MQKSVNYAAIFSFLAVVMAVIAVFGVYTQESVEVPSVDNIADAVAVKVLLANNVGSNVTTEAPVSLDNEKIDAIYEEMFKEDTKEDIAERLALEVMEDRDVKRNVMQVLNDNGENVEDYKDIVSIYSVSVEDVVVSGESASVVIEFRVRYFNDGDDEDEDLQKAKLSVEVSIDGLDEDEDYEDAEAEEPSVEDFSLLKIYE